MPDGIAETTWASEKEKWYVHRDLECTEALEGNPGGRRRKGRPRKRWLDDVQDDMIKMDVKRWRTKATDRGEWRKICETAKVLQELCSHGEEEEEEEEEEEVFLQCPQVVVALLRSEVIGTQRYVPAAGERFP
jgi:hypothetical protein